MLVLSSQNQKKETWNLGYNVVFQKTNPNFKQNLGEVTSRNQNTVRVGCHAVEDRVVTTQVLDEIALGEFPLFNIIRRTRCHRISEGETHFFNKIRS